MVEGVYLTAPDGGVIVTVRLPGAWPWLVLLLGTVFVAVGGYLVS